MYRLTRATWRSTDTLHRYGLIDRVKDLRRSFTTGKVGDSGTRWAKGEVMPVHYKINDEGLRQPAVATIRRVLTAPTDADRARREGRELIAGLKTCSPHPAEAVAGTGRTTLPAVVCVLTPIGR